MASVMAGFRFAPELPKACATSTPHSTPRAHPVVTTIQPASAAYDLRSVTLAHTPLPSRIRTSVPRNSPNHTECILSLQKNGIFVRSGLSPSLDSTPAYSGSTIAVLRNHCPQVAFSSRKCHSARYWKGHVNCGTALEPRLLFILHILCAELFLQHSRLDPAAPHLHGNQYHKDQQQPGHIDP